MVKVIAAHDWRRRPAQATPTVGPWRALASDKHSLGGRLPAARTCLLLAEPAKADNERPDDGHDDDDCDDHHDGCRRCAAAAVVVVVVAVAVATVGDDIFSFLSSLLR